MKGSRLALTTVLGFIAGFASWWWMRGIPGSEAAAVILSRAVLGFAIGLSAWKLNWALHGIILGAIFSLPLAAGAVWVHLGAAGFFEWLISGLVIGFLIELIATPIFHMGRQTLPTPQPHPSM